MVHGAWRPVSDVAVWRPLGAGREFLGGAFYDSKKLIEGEEELEIELKLSTAFVLEKTLPKG